MKKVYDEAKKVYFTRGKLFIDVAQPKFRIACSFEK